MNQLDLVSTAQQHGMCGQVQCTANYQYNQGYAASSGSRTTNVPCTGSSGEEIGPSQYAVKFVCGKTIQDKVVQPGYYNAVVNIHNPNENTTLFRWKVAFATSTADGPITAFTNTTIGPDASQRYECPKGTQNVGLFDGYFVIQANDPLDVTAYYSAGQPQVTSIDVKTVQRRPIEKVDFDCQSNYKIDLSNPANWKKSDGNPASAVPGAPSSWDPNRTWISYDPSAGAETTIPQDSTYSMKFCSCSAKGGSVLGDVKSDNGSSGTLTAPSPASQQLFTPVASPGNFHSTDTAASISKSFTGSGDGAISVTVHNNEFQTGVSFTGQLTLASGYAGECKKP